MGLYFIRITLILSFLLTLAVACDPMERPFLIRNNLPEAVKLRFLNGRGLNISAGKGNVGGWERALELAVGEEALIGINQTADNRYTIIVEDSQGKELSRRLFYRQDLEQRLDQQKRYRLVIDEQGIH